MYGAETQSTRFDDASLSESPTCLAADFSGPLGCSLVVTLRNTLSKGFPRLPSFDSLFLRLSRTRKGACSPRNPQVSPQNEHSALATASPIHYEY